MFTGSAVAERAFRRTGPIRRWAGHAARDHAVGWPYSCAGMASNPSISLPRPAATFWWIYAAMWLPCGASYVVVFLVTGESLGDAIADTIYDVVPAALWGVAVVWVCGRVPWTPRGRVRFFAAQLALAIAYSALWVVSIALVFTIARSMERGTLSFNYLRGWAMQWTVFSGFMLYGTIASVCYARQIALRWRAEQVQRWRQPRLSGFWESSRQVPPWWGVF